MKQIFRKFQFIKRKDVLAIFVMLAALPYALLLRCKRDNIWLICEDENEARDNGYWFYKYMRIQHPEYDVVYAINKKSPDYARVKNLGQVISYGGYVHWAYYMAAKLNISSQKGGKPNAAVCYALEVSGLWKNKRIFLQHGVTKDDAEWLYYKNTKMRLFICGARKEYEYVKKQFGYPKDHVAYTGFSRFDGLHNIKIKENQILVMPSWRQWIAHPSSVSKEFDEVDNFCQTEYFQKWNEFLHDSALHHLLEQYDYNLIFYPHRNMQQYLNTFQCNFSRITIADWKHYDVQKLLKESSFLITDYSSVFMDFAYMKKPMLYYQFDEKKFRKGQYREGYFSYDRNGFGPVCRNLEDVRKSLESYLNKDDASLKIYYKREEEFFPLCDNKNSERIYQIINKL